MVFYPCHDFFINTIRDDSPKALARIRGNSANPDLKGTVRFYKTPYEGILVAAEVYHLPTNAPTGSSSFYGFHIHETGDCTDDFAGTGGHYNPSMQTHPFHAGDMPPLLSYNGYAWMCFYAEQLTIPEIIGKAVVIHDHADDFTTQPSGNSGNKIGCGVIYSF